MKGKGIDGGIVGTPRRGTEELRFEGLNVRDAGEEREGCPPGVLMQGCDSMGVNGYEHAKDIRLDGDSRSWMVEVTGTLAAG